MKKKITLFILLLLGFIIFPNNIKADTYNSLNLKETLAEEEIAEVFTDYKETSDQITIYLFRGKGCGFCRAFLEFLNSITDEYGKYYKLVSYEVWNDANNSKLMGEVSNFLGQPASGVPYIIIGDKVFAGYSDTYDDSIKQAITDLYNTKQKKRYDVFKEMKNNTKKESSTINNTLIYSLLFTILSTIVIITFIDIKAKELKIEIAKISEISSKNEQKNKKAGK